MGSGALKACEVSLQNKYVMLINTDESDVDVESTSMNPANADLVVEGIIAAQVTSSH